MESIFENGGFIGVTRAYDDTGIFLLKSAVIGLYAFTTATFTPGTATGRTGPSLTQARAGLSGPEVNDWRNNTEFFNASGGIQRWTVPRDGTYSIEAWGAQGGRAGGGGSGLGGLGARVRGDFYLTKNEVLRIVVGQQGVPHGSERCAGGGGGSFVLKESGFTTNDILVIAGGGGGGASSVNGFEGSDTTSATGTRLVTVGDGGLGWNGSCTPGFACAAAGGAGWNTNGQNAQNVTDSGGKSPANGFFGGNATQVGCGSGGREVGGFGGGGAGTCLNWNSGGGGGYTGGSGGGGGGGGGSFNSGTNQSNNSGVRSENGQVTITFIG